jgi:Asp-tRNA(Asn)/Glu-tRNA(Gln) amidotransferase A subunit family amidase
LGYFLLHYSCHFVYPRLCGCYVFDREFIPAPRFYEKTVSIDDNVLQTREALLRNTIVFNSTGLPAVNIPIGLTKDNMPVGAQIIGPPFKEDLILSMAYNYERINNSMDKFVPHFAAIKKEK